MGNRKYSARGAALLVAGLLAGCGGGGGGGAANVSPTLIVTPANASAAAETVLVAGSLADALGLELYSLISELYVTFPVSVDEQSAPDARSLGSAIAVIANNTLGLDGILRVRASEVARGRLDCDSGFVDFEVDITDTSLTAPTVGDRIELDFFQCDGFEGIPGFIDGFLSIRIAVLNSTALQIAANTSSFEISDGLLDASSTGDINVRFFRNQDRIRITSDSLRIVEQGQVYELNNFEWIEDFPNFPFVDVSGNGNAAGTPIGGEWVAFDIDTPYTVSLFDDFPGSGSFLILGAEDSAARFTILSTTMVRIETDADGDGIFESSEDLLWTQILPPF